MRVRLLQNQPKLFLPSSSSLLPSPSTTSTFTITTFSLPLPLSLSLSLSLSISDVGTFRVICAITAVSSVQLVASGARTLLGGPVSITIWQTSASPGRVWRKRSVKLLERSCCDYNSGLRCSGTFWSQSRRQSFAFWASVLYRFRSLSGVVPPH